MRTILKDIREAAFHTLCKVLLCCISWPFSLLARSSKKRQREIDAGYRIESLPGGSIVKKRRRALTLPLPLPIGSQKDGHASSPPSGLLLTKLPTELRQYIWRECMGDINFHIGFGWEQHLHSIVCCSPNPERCDDMYGHTRCWKYSSPRSVRNRPELCVVSLLLTCRQIYSEAIHHLYASNSFVTIDSKFVLYLPRLFLPQRIACIRSFRFKWDRIWGPASYDEEGPLKRRPNYLRVSWNTIWKNLAEMRGLNELRVKLTVVDHRAWENIGTERAIALFEPVMEVTSPSFFELVLPFACKSDEAPWNALPCHIRLTTNVDDGVQLI